METHRGVSRVVGAGIHPSKKQGNCRSICQKFPLLFVTQEKYPLSMPLNSEGVSKCQEYEPWVDYEVRLNNSDRTMIIVLGSTHFASLVDTRLFSRRFPFLDVLDVFRSEPCQVPAKDPRRIGPSMSRILNLICYVISIRGKKRPMTGEIWHFQFLCLRPFGCGIHQAPYPWLTRESTRSAYVWVNPQVLERWDLSECVWPCMFCLFPGVTRLRKCGEIGYILWLVTESRDQPRPDHVFLLFLFIMSWEFSVIFRSLGSFLLTVWRGRWRWSLSTKGW